MTDLPDRLHLEFSLSPGADAPALLRDILRRVDAGEVFISAVDFEDLPDLSRRMTVTYMEMKGGKQ